MMVISAVPSWAVFTAKDTLHSTEPPRNVKERNPPKKAFHPYIKKLFLIG